VWVAGRSLAHIVNLLRPVKPGSELSLGDSEGGAVTTAQPQGGKVAAADLSPYGLLRLPESASDLQGS